MCSNLVISSYNYFQLKNYLKVDPETRSYDFLTKTHEKNPRSGNVRNMAFTLEKQMIGGRFGPTKENVKMIINVHNTKCTVCYEQSCRYLRCGSTFTFNYKVMNGL